MINDTWSFCTGTLPESTESGQTALAVVDVFVLFFGCDWNEIAAEANNKGYEAVLGNFPPELYAQVWGIYEPVPAEAYPNLLGFKWTEKGHTIPVAITQGFNDICPNLADCNDAKMDLVPSYEGFGGFIALTTVYGLIALIFILLRLYHTALRFREMYPAGLNMLRNPAFYVILTQFVAAPFDLALFCDWTVTLGVYNTNVSHMFSSVSIFCSNMTTAMLAALQLHVARQFLPKYYLVIGSFLAFAGVALMEVGTLLFYSTNLLDGNSEANRRIICVTGLIAITTCFLVTRLYLLKNISLGARAEGEVAKVTRMARLLFLSALFMTVWVIASFMNLAWVAWEWSPIFYWSFLKAAVVFEGPIFVLGLAVVPFLHVYALPYKSDKATTASNQ